MGVYLYILTILTVQLAHVKCQSISTSVGTTVKMPGETFTVTCSGYLIEEDQVVKFVRTGVTIINANGLTTLGYDEENPTVIATFDEVTPALTTATSGRYTATGTKTDLNFDYTYAFSDLKPLDTGNYTCIISNADGTKAAQGSLNAITVKGPIISVDVAQKAVSAGADFTLSTPSTDPADGVDGILDIVLPEPDSDTDPGQVACVAKVTTTPPIKWNMELYDPVQNKTINVDDKFRNQDIYSDTKITYLESGLYEYSDTTYFRTKAHQTKPAFDYKYSGNHLKFTAEVAGYDAKMTTVMLNLKYSPRETYCYPNDPRSPIGEKNFTVICYSRANPTATIKFEVKGSPATAVRDGITVRQETKQQYKIAIVTFDEVKEEDFTAYTFTANNDISSPVTTDVDIVKGNEAYGTDIDSLAFPWNKAPDNGDTTDSGVQKLFPSIFSLTLLIFCRWVLLSA